MFEVAIEPTNVCNLACTFCPNPDFTREYGMMDFDLYRKTIDEVALFKPRTLHLQDVGESFLHKKIIEMIEYATPHFDVVQLNTNGVNLEGELAERLVKTDLDNIKFSIDAARPETYKALKKKDKLAVVERNLESLLKLRDAARARMRIFAKFVTVDGNRGEEEAFRKRWEGIADKVLFKEEHGWDGTYGKSVHTNEPGQRYRCHYLWRTVNIHWDGKVVPCCVDWDDKAVFGNVKEKPVYDIFFGAEATRFREEHLAGKYHPLCANCVYWQYDADFARDLPANSAEPRK